MKAITVYYTLTGITKLIAESFAKELGCELFRWRKSKRAASWAPIYLEQEQR